MSLNAFTHTFLGIIGLLIPSRNGCGGGLHFLVAFEVLDARPGINCWFILNFLGFGAVSEGAQTLVLVLAMWGDRHDHASS